MQAVVDMLETVTQEQVAAALDTMQEVDPSAGIVIARLENVPGVQTNGLLYEIYAARVLPATSESPNFVTPHYHLHGEEPYRFLRGANGEMNTGVVDNDSVVWNEPRLVQPGHVFIVGEGEVHSFRNLGTEPYDFSFACPASHLVDWDAQTAPDGDRYITRELPNGIPPWYPS